MDKGIYDKIREENIRNYGVKVSKYGPMLLGNLYSERTHFIYELLQNAEDASERAKRQGQTRKFVVSFHLYPDRLEVRNNGIPFDENDVRGICGIGEVTKAKSLTQIGKFGIGFKSVYAYTTSPEVHSGEYSFFIKDLVHPFPKKLRKDALAGETLFIIPFNKRELEPKIAFSEINKKLGNLGLRTILFLKNIEEINFKTESLECKYLRRIRDDGSFRQISIHYFENGIERSNETWLVFDKTANKDKSHRLEIAYLLVRDSHSGRDTIAPANYVRLYVYFPTEKETHLRFLIQGPFNTTPARDNIKNDEKNLKLIEETATFVSENISKIKALDLLDVGFLSALPIDTDYFVMQDSLFEPIYEKVKEKLYSHEALLPTYDGSFATVNQSLIARGEDLRRLLSGDQLDLLFGRNGSKWLDPDITENRTPDLWKYLTEVLLIKVVDPESFARAFDEDFIEKQSDQWIVSFYDFLSNQKALWRESRPSGILRSKPIIRLEDNSHRTPFDVFGKPNAYLPSKDRAMRKHFPNVVKETVVANKKAREFLKALGLDEPGIVAAVLKLVLPCYEKEGIVPDKDNIEHVELILQALDNCAGSKRENLLSELERTPFLYAVNASTHQSEYKEPTDIHLGEKYAGITGLEAYFDGNKEVWFLDERYLAIHGIEGALGKFKEIGCRPAIMVRYRKPDFLDYVKVSHSYGRHVRGLKGFDLNCEIEGLEHALQNITLERSRILWQIARRYRRSIHGEVESCSKQNYEGSTKHSRYSKMGKLLVEHAWLPDSSSHFHKPSELTLSDLPDDFDKESHEAEYLAEKLGMKSEANRQLQQLLDKAPHEVKEILNQARPLLEMYISVPPEQQKRILESVRSIVMSEKETPEEEKTISVSPTGSELWYEFHSALEQDRSEIETPEDKRWTGPTPEEEEALRKHEMDALSKISGRQQTIKTEYEMKKRVKYEDRGEPVLRAFFLEQYKGHCQVCNVKLDLGPHKDPWFEIYRLIEKRKLYGEWSEQGFNTLCLCPNCHALMKHGGRELNGIVKKAKQVAMGEAAPEEVRERNGDFYIVNVNIAGKEKELFYTPTHMAKVSAFVKFIEDHLA